MLWQDSQASHHAESADRWPATPHRVLVWQPVKGLRNVTVYTGVCPLLLLLLLSAEVFITCFCFPQLHKPQTVFISRFTCPLCVVYDVVMYSMFLCRIVIKSQKILPSPFWKYIPVYIIYHFVITFCFIFCMKLSEFSLHLFICHQII